MKWVSVVSERLSLDAAADDVAYKVERALDGAAPDLALIFLSGYSAADVEKQHSRLRAVLPGAFIGCTAGGVVGGGHELEQRPGVSAMVASLPGVEAHSFHLRPADLGPGRLSPAVWHRRLELTPTHQPAFVLLPDALTCDANRLVQSLDAAFPSAPKVGGIASGARPPAHNALLCDDTVVEGGVVGVALVGDLVMDTVVAQGCRPLGGPMAVTRCNRNLLFELDGRPAVEVLDAFFSALPGEARALFGRGPLLGVGIDPHRGSPRRGDFLIRNLVGVDRERAVVGVGAPLRTGQIVQFHARDARTSDEDIHELLGRYRREAGEAPAGALMFSCVGRGAGLYGIPDHDSRVFRQHLGSVPLAGFFCGGEIGPVHTRTFVHGLTSSFGMFRPRGWN